MNKAKINVRLLPGAEGIKQAYEESLKAHSLDIVCLSENYVNVIGDYFDKAYAPRLYREMRTREILPDTAGNRTDAQKKDSGKNQVRFIKSGGSESDYLLYGDTAILVSFNEAQPYSLIIQDQELVANLQSQFESLWNSLS